MKTLIRVFLSLTLLIIFCTTLYAADATKKKSKPSTQSVSKSEFLTEDINLIAENIISKVPFKCSLLILDFEDVNGVITNFGRYVADRLHISLSNMGSNISIIERRNIEIALKEQEFQISGYVDQKTAVRISSLTGATHIVSGVVTELPEKISIDVKILDVERGLVIGGISHEIQKTREVSSLVSTIIKTEEKKQIDLENQRQVILQEVETERQKRLQALQQEEQAMMKALDTEINTKKAELVILDDEIRKKSIVIADYEKKRKVLEEKNAYVMQIHEQIDKLNLSVEQKLKIGMRSEQVYSVLGIKQTSYDLDRCDIVGKYFVIFENNILIKVVRNGSRTKVGSMVDSCGFARVSGINVAPY